MLEQETQPLNIPTDVFLAKPAQPEIQMNSQGERIEAPSPQNEAPNNPPQETQQAPQEDWDISLGDTPLADGFDALYDATDDTGMEHKIISCGHVLKSTHDLARWSEKTGARRVNGQESIDSVSDIAINLEPYTGNNTRTKGGNNNETNSSSNTSVDISGLFNEGGNGGRNTNRRRNRNGGGKQQWQPVASDVKSEVINCWPVLKSTHDQAQPSEKRGRNAVNKSESSQMLDELATNQQQGQGGKQPNNRSRNNRFRNNRFRNNKSTNGQEQAGNQPKSEILHSWPVLKSTHDQATWSEKHGSHAVNSTATGDVLDELALDQTPRVQAGGGQGNSLQSGLDTQAGSHVQFDNVKSRKETPEQIMAELHLHV